LTSNGTVVLYDHLCSCALVFGIVKHDSLVAHRSYLLCSGALRSGDRIRGPLVSGNLCCKALRCGSDRI
jgi:hypothetical protein